MTVGVVTIHVGGMTEADVMIAGQSTLDIAIQQSGERRLARTTKVRGTMCGERGREDGVDVRKKDRWRMMWMSPREGEGDDGFRATKERE